VNVCYNHSSKLVFAVESMKCLAVILLYLIVFNVSNLLAQNDSHTFYYPLNIGDRWEYRVNSAGFITFETRKVVGDTLMPNGKLYRIIEAHSPPFGSRRVFQRLNDSTEVFEFFGPDEFLLFKLDIKVGDSWKFPISSSSDSATFQVTQIADTTLFSKTFKFANLFVPEGFQLNFFLGDSIGTFVEESEGLRLELRGAIINGQQIGNITSVRDIVNGKSDGNESFFNNYPNPFNHSTRISYVLNSPNRVRIQIFNILGKEVQSYDVGVQQAGTHTKVWSGDNQGGVPVSSGLYYYLIRSESQTLYRGSMTFIK